MEEQARGEELERKSEKRGRGIINKSNSKNKKMEKGQMKVMRIVVTSMWST